MNVWPYQPICNRYLGPLAGSNRVLYSPILNLVYVHLSLSKNLYECVAMNTPYLPAGGVCISYSGPMM